MIIMSEAEDSIDEVREAAIGALNALLYSLAIIKGDNNQEQLSNFLDIILKSQYLQFILSDIEPYTTVFFCCRFQ